jgi:hypothetical protein
VRTNRWKTIRRIAEMVHLLRKGETVDLNLLHGLIIMLLREEATGETLTQRTAPAPNPEPSSTADEVQENAANALADLPR